MLNFKKQILDHFRVILTTHNGWEIQDIYDDMDDRMKGAILPGMEPKLFHDLLPEIVDWINACFSNRDAQILTVIEYAMHLIKEEKLSSLTPFIIRAIYNNKKIIIKSLLDEANESIDTGKDHKKYLIKILDDLNTWRIDWPELEVIRRGIS